MTALFSAARGARRPGDGPRPPRGSRPGRFRGLWNASPLTYVTLVAALALSVFPIYWMVVVATRGNDVVSAVPPPMLPGGRFGDNARRLFDNPDAHFAKGLANSAIVASAVTVSTVFFASLAGFAFAKLRFRGRGALLLTVIATMMVPVQMGVVPLYMIMVELGWQNRLQAVVVPFLVTGFGVFMMRQYADQAVPDELVEAARVDGCSTFGVFWRVVLPALRPAAGVLGLFTFMQTWNEFMWPLAVLSPDNPTVQLSINNLSAAYFKDYTLMFAGTTVAVLPLLVVFIVFGRQIIGGIMEGAVKV
ncbi:MULTISPECIES: carbohydrate ABC transporter permease [Actinomadura]|uniref:Carbohydrate ABC transporter permease n=1 Tax=Actinomadura yumaensis TaxID=111807 RepID=A0ABW2CVN7_9ACTN|nr:carbohydrate ABC transporter permease [Actinomadura sp. J1-007]MWK37744.1 ABC transporter permease subunit [Actinomadura sp. J1-007]